MKAKCPKCGYCQALEFFADTSSLESQLQEWKQFLDQNAYWVSPDNRVRTATAAVLLGRSESTLRAWRAKPYGPEWRSGSIVTYRLEELANFYLTVGQSEN